MITEIDLKLQFCREHGTNLESVETTRKVEYQKWVTKELLQQLNGKDD